MRPFLGLSTAFSIDGHLFLPQIPPSLYRRGTRLSIPPPSQITPSWSPLLFLSSLTISWGFLKVLFSALPIPLPRWSHPSLRWDVLNTITTRKCPKAAPLTAGSYLCLIFPLGSQLRISKVRDNSCSPALHPQSVASLFLPICTTYLTSAKKTFFAYVMSKWATVSSALFPNCVPGLSTSLQLHCHNQA